MLTPSRSESGAVGAGARTQAGAGGDDPPAQFLWRGRLYVVRAVLAHWIEVGAWWRSAARVLDDRTGMLSLPGAPGDGRAGSGGAGTSGGTGSTGDGGLPGGLPDPVERQVWRVEASAGRSATLGVYDLACDAQGRSWQLARTLD